MTKERATEIWDKILHVLDEKLQYSFREQARSVILAEIEGSELYLTVTSAEARDFFNSSVNQHRLSLLVRPVITLEKVVATLVEGEPLR